MKRKIILKLLTRCEFRKIWLKNFLKNKHINKHYLFIIY